jgi:CO/xanthine dehydrogenase FAD-binding subunit
MERFTYAAPQTVTDAVLELSSAENVKVLAGGTTLIDLMKNGVERPQRLIDVTGIKELNEFAIDEDELRFGAILSIPATSDNRELAAPRSMVSTAGTRYWERASSASPSTPAIGPQHSQPSMRRSIL